ncbi:TIGR02186 family protein [Xanthobacter sp. AM11]|uniref:TIGR02186 family protein n=1 Tax=Xanthobacter sp. AM11 TaxID=3380643 RepID=UPI0039BED04F
MIGAKVRSAIRAARAKVSGGRLLLLVAAAPAALAAAAPAVLAAAAPAWADRLVLSVSQPQVRITSSFAGADLVVFGVAEMEGAGPAAPDVVVSVRGPRENFTTWRKSRVLGLWVNSDSRTFLEVPAFLHVMANRPPEAMASPETLRVEQIGLARNILVQRIGPDFADVVPTDPFRAAFLRIQAAQGFYREDPHGVAFLAPHVFRTEVSIPGVAPLGRYTVEVKLLRQGNVTATATTTFDVEKTGIEQKIAEFSQQDRLIYGFVVAFGSLIVGFIGNLLFRKE